MLRKQLRRVQAFIPLGRLAFLPGGVMFHVLGVVMALDAGATFNPAAFIWGRSQL